MHMLCKGCTELALLFWPILAIQLDRRSNGIVHLYTSCAHVAPRFVEEAVRDSLAHKPVIARGMAAKRDSPGWRHGSGVGPLSKLGSLIS